MILPKKWEGGGGGEGNTGFVWRWYLMGKDLRDESIAQDSPFFVVGFLCMQVELHDSKICAFKRSWFYKLHFAFPFF